MNSITDRVRNTLIEYKMLRDTRSILVGFSGGADSVTLLHCLKILRDDFGYDLYAVHVNHNIRGEEAMRDRIFCEGFCAENGICFFCENVDVPKLAAEAGVSVEEAARNARYGIFEDIRKNFNIDKIATAHNSDDNIETVLFNICRGTSLHGLGGIPHVRGNIIRPLIMCPKSDIINYCNENRLSFVTDSTNTDNSYTRNYIRNEIVPLMKNINPSLDVSVHRMCGAVRSDDEYIRERVGLIPDDITRAELAELHDSLLSRYLIEKYLRVSESIYSIENHHVASLTDAVRRGIPKRISLPEKIDFFTDDVKFVSVDTMNKRIKKQYLKTGENPIPDSDSMILMTHNKKDIKPLINIYKSFIYKKLYFDRIKGCIYIRSRENGDKYMCGGMTRSVKKLMCDRHIPLYERNMIPMICDDAGILWIPGFDVRDDVNAANEPDDSNLSESDILYITYYKGVGCDGD